MQNSGIAEKSTHLKYKEFTVCDDRDGMLHDFIKYRNQIRISPLESFIFDWDSSFISVSLIFSRITIKSITFTNIIFRSCSVCLNRINISSN